MRRHVDAWGATLGIGPQVQLTQAEHLTLTRAADILRRARDLMADDDGTAECTIGAADAALADFLRDIDPRDRLVDMVPR